VSRSPTEILTTPRQDDLGLTRIVNGAGFSIGLLPNGAVFAIEHVEAGRRIMINQTLASPIASGMGRLYLRLGGPEPQILPVIGPEARLRVGALDDRFVWEGEQSGMRHQVTLWLHPRSNLWQWRVEAVNLRDSELPCDAVFIQDLGLGEQGFLMNNEAYASQYLDHHIAHHPRLNHVLMSRQNLSRRSVVDVFWLPQLRPPGGLDRRRPEPDREGRTRLRRLAAARSRPFLAGTQPAARCAIRGRRQLRREGDKSALPAAQACRTGRRASSVLFYSGTNV